MCGIVGILRRRGGTVDPKILDAMTDRLEHRGPDGRGTYRHEGVGFGHRRLSIIGVGDGAQPMANEDGTIVATYNGEIYNYLPLKEELERLGHRFRTHSDTEVLVHGYEAWGNELARRLRGIFAFAIHDQKKRRIYCARDRLGVKPFYYLETPTVFAFASEPKALLLHPEVPRRPDMDGIHLYLRHGFIAGGYSAFEGIRQLEPGRFMIATEDTLYVERYWSPPVPGSRSCNDVPSTLDRILDESVRIELMSEVPLGAFLSGGIDSSAVLASMTKNRELGAPKSFSIGFSVPEYDESRHAERVAKHLGLDHHVEIVDRAGLDLLDTLVDVYDEPFADSSAIPVYVLSAMTKKHVTVALSGDGGDELFGGYRRYKKIAAEHPLPPAFRRVFRRALAHYPLGRRGEGRVALLGSSLAERYDREMTLFPEHWIREMFTPDLHREPVWSIAKTFDSAPGGTAVQRAQWTDIEGYLPADILMKVDRASMAHALEVRVPLLDHEFVEWALALPSEHQFGDGTAKVALKDHLARRIPRHLFERPKMGFGVPLEYWLGGNDGLEQIAERLRARHPKHGFFSPMKPVLADLLFRRHREGRNMSAPLWALLFLETWWQKHFA